MDSESSLALELALRYGYSVDLVELLLDYFSFSRLDAILASLKSPSRYYSFRVNTLKISCERLLSLLRERGFEVCLHPKIEEAFLIEVEGPFDVPLLDKVVVVDKFAAESVMQGAQLYAPGVLSADGVFEGDEVSVVDVEGRVVAVGVAMMDGVEMIKRRRGLAVKISLSKFKSISLRELDEYSAGFIYEQSIPAMLTSMVLSPSPGEVVVDMCAAPGGKTSHIAQLMGNTGRIYAFDNSRTRLAKLVENVNRLGVRNVVAINSDARYIHLDYPNLRADKVLIDPPCSALGVRPKLFEGKSRRDVISCMNYQKQFFRSAVEVVRSGGVIVYSTCTLTFEENELIVDFALNNYPLELDEQPIYLGSCGIKVSGRSLLQRFYPDIHGTPGYFIARFVRI